MDDTMESEYREAEMRKIHISLLRGSIITTTLLGILSLVSVMCRIHFLILSSQFFRIFCFDFIALVSIFMLFFFFFFVILVFSRHCFPKGNYCLFTLT